jgi:DnaD/phage-associated family protein
MSIYAMTLVFQSGLEKSQKAIALSYADHAHDDGSHIYPSVAYTAWKTGYSERSVQRITKDLVKNKIIIPDGKGEKGTNRYKMIFENLPQREPFQGGDILTGGVTTTTGGVTTTTFRGDTVSPKPLVNHKEPSLLNLSGDFAAVVSAYENNIAPITPIMSETIQEALDEFGAEDIVEAIGLAVKADVRKWAYVNGILKRWRKNGKQKRNIVKVENGGGMYV